MKKISAMSPEEINRQPFWRLAIEAVRCRWHIRWLRAYIALRTGYLHLRNVARNPKAFLRYWAAALRHELNLFATAVFKGPSGYELLRRAGLTQRFPVFPKKEGADKEHDHRPGSKK